MLVYSHGTVRMYRLSRMVCCRSWSTEPLGNRVAKYCRKSLVSTPGKQPTSQKIQSDSEGEIETFSSCVTHCKTRLKYSKLREENKGTRPFFSPSQYYIFNSYSTVKLCKISLKHSNSKDKTKQRHFGVVANITFLLVYYCTSSSIN